MLALILFSFSQSLCCSYPAVCDFLQNNNLLSIIRAHEAQDAGYVFPVFSSLFYLYYLCTNMCLLTFLSVHTSTVVAHFVYENT